MKKITSKFLTCRLCLISFILLSGLFISDNAFCRKHWDRSFVYIRYLPISNSIIIDFRVYDYDFGPADENGYLRWCDFAYTTDNTNYKHLMRAETNDQGRQSWTWLKMRYKEPGAEIEFLDCFRPDYYKIWPDTGEDEEIYVMNDFGIAPNGNIFYLSKAHFTVKWFLGEAHNDVKRIRLNGFWKVNGPYKGDDITDIYYDIPGRAMLKSNTMKNIPLTSDSGINTTVSKKASLKVSVGADAIIVKGADLGENIKVYNALGSEVKSVVANSDAVNINLAKNQVYVVTVGKARYKVAL